MSNPIFQFGETRPEFDVPVLNERAVRAAAGILFAGALITFMQAFLLGNFRPTQIFVIAFLIDFTIRLFVNPRLAPTMIVGQWMVNSQQPEWAGAPQKRFAWGIGFLLALGMFFLMVVNHTVGPINMLVCGTCLLLLFFETSFGICIGCKIYNMLPGRRAQLCPGGACELPPEPLDRIRPGTAGIVAVYLALMIGVGLKLDTGPVSTLSAQRAAATGDTSPDRCVVPAFAKFLGHEDKWKQHNNCP
ncbi:MAG: DUF4395 domain-containing protein [Beijerinckiaceae bacterium]